MTPPYSNKGRRFKFENDLDDVLWSFIQAIDVYDSRQADRLRLVKLRATPEFQKAYDELGSPDVWKGYRPSTRAYGLIDPNETKRLHTVLKRALKHKDGRIWKKHRQKYVDNVLAEYRAATDWICTATNRQSMADLIHTLKRSKDDQARQDALLSLVELDMSFFTLPDARRIIKQAEIAADDGFRMKLSQRLDQKHQGEKYERQRQRYALFVLSSLGYEQKSYGQWSRFFRYFNEQLGDRSGRSPESGFWSFEQWHTVKAAINKHDVPKKAAKPGRRKKRANKS